MAERYRKGRRDRLVINCRITPEAKTYLAHLAGEFGLGHAIELLVKERQRRHTRRKSAVKPLSQFALLR